MKQNMSNWAGSHNISRADNFLESETGTNANS